MYEVCQRSKYGFCKFGKKCDKIHFTDICEENDKCKEKYCDKSCFSLIPMEDVNLENFALTGMKKTLKSNLERK